MLAGGGSRRFGSDKTRALIDGRPLLDLAVSAVAEAVDEVVVVGPWAPDGVRHVLEPERGQGPLAGLVHGLRSVSVGHVLVVGGDHPLLVPTLLRLLLDHRHDADALVPLRDGEPEPLVACYRRDVALAAADALLAEGRRKLMLLLDAVTVHEIDEVTWRQVDPDGRSFEDVDTPGDLTSLKRVLDG